MPTLVFTIYPLHHSAGCRFVVFNHTGRVCTRETRVIGLWLRNLQTDILRAGKPDCTNGPTGHLRLAANPPGFSPGSVSGEENPFPLARESRERLVPGGPRHVEHAFFVLGPILADIARPAPLGLRPGGRAEGWESAKDFLSLYA